MAELQATITVGSPDHKVWWRSLTRAGAPVELVVRGRRRTGDALATRAGDRALVRVALDRSRRSCASQALAGPPESQEVLPRPVSPLAASVRCGPSPFARWFDLYRRRVILMFAGVALGQWRGSVPHLGEAHVETYRRCGGRGGGARRSRARRWPRARATRPRTKLPDERDHRRPLEVIGGNMAEGKTGTPAVQTLAARLVEDHGQWLKEAVAEAGELGIKAPGSPTPPEQWEIAISNSLTGNAFDKWWSDLKGPRSQAGHLRGHVREAVREQPDHQEDGRARRSPRRCGPTSSCPTRR